VRQPVAHFFEPAREAGVIKHEADIIFDHPQSFARAIGRRIEDSPEVDTAARLTEFERGNSLGQRQGSEVDLDGFGETLASHLEIQPRFPQQVSDGASRLEQARQQVLGSHFSTTVRPPSLNRRLVQYKP
jgi:hypothetical protein